MQNKNDAVGQASHAAALLVTLYEGDEIQDAARILIEQEIEIEELRVTLASQSGAEVPSLLDVMSLIREQGHRQYLAGVNNDEVDAEHMHDIENAVRALAQHSTQEVPSAEGAVINYGSPQG